MNTTTSASLTQPALLGGLVMGLLSVLPIVNVGNACCCMWVVSGGLVAAYVLQQNQAMPITPAEGALAGLAAGVLGAAIHMVLSVPIDLLMAPFERAMMQRVMNMAGNVPPEVRDMMDRMSNQNGAAGLAGMVLRRVVGFIFMLFVGAIFSTLGGVLGAALFKKQAPPATA